MLVQVTSDSSACYFTLVHANVEAMSPTNGLQDLHCLLSECSVFKNFFLRGVSVVGDVSVRDDK
jgi:hypothetical protein